MRILLIEDDLTLCHHLKRKLGESGFVLDLAHDGEEGEVLGNDSHYQAVVLDLGIPRRSGLDVLKNWRRHHNGVPVIVLTARNTWQERVQGIEAGADDYLGKPFHVEELIARLKALIYRAQSRSPGPLTVAGYVLDEQRQWVTPPDGAPVQLSATEFRLLRVFMLKPHQMLPKEQLLEAIYDYDSTADHNVIEVYVNHLRKKLGREIIQTHRLQGYCFAPGEKR